ncbi:MAG: enoyl-ACP reductase [Bacteriovoracaceae bacterium]|nr:enoyl-ACP reductase [Bacteriovoracaceae bacterium]
MLRGKKALITGLANKNSIATAIAQSLTKNGASVGISYFHDSNTKRVVPLAKEMEAKFVVKTDITSDSELDQLSQTVKDEFGTFDFLVHSIAFADARELTCRFHQTSREGFRKCLDISSYSLIALSQKLRSMINRDGSIIGMTYMGADKVLQGYGVMGVAKAALQASARYLADDLGQEGIRVNTISAGPVKTLAAFGIPSFSDFLQQVEDYSPLRRNIDQDDVASAALYLCSEHSRSVTGQNIFVDSGISIIKQSKLS